MLDLYACEKLCYFVAEKKDRYYWKHEMVENEERKISFGLKSMKSLSRFRKKRRDMHFYHLDNTENLSWKIKLSYCAPTLSTLPIVLLLAVYGTQFYETLGANLAYISFFIALARSFDVVSDPLMSYLTDSFRSKYGRRRPFIITGCWLYSIFMVLLLSPPRLSSVGLSMWFGFFYVLFFLASTYTNIPYDALGPELTDNYEDRSRLFFVSGLFDGFGALIAIIFPVSLSNYINFTTVCPDALKSCYSTTGIGTACHTTAGTEDFATYSIGKLDALLYNVTNCNQVITSQGEVNTQAGCIEGVHCFCQCALNCSTNCKLDNERRAYNYVGIFFGLWYTATMVNCFLQIRERGQIKKESEENKKEEMPAPPMVPSMLNTLKNHPFKKLLPAWACDAVVNGIIASMMTYFVRYVIRPEYSDGCIGRSTESWKCNSQYVLGASVTMLLFVAFLSTPIWLFVNQKVGKRKAWLLWSFTMALTNILFIFVGQGDVMPCIIITGINGLPFGAKFLADAILSDIIDYDEFLSGARSEATYTMFKSFLPKIGAIPASAIPIALLNSFGHVAPIDGVIQRQPAFIETYVRLVAVIIPTTISIIGFVIKLQFPFKDKAQVDMISEGVGKHLLKQSGIDPVTRNEIAYIAVTPEEQGEIYRLDYFPSTAFVENYALQAEQSINGKENPANVLLVKKMKFQFTTGLCCLFVSMLISFFTFSLMSDAQLSFVPVLAIIAVGVSFTSSGFCYLRYLAAQDLAKRPPTMAILQLAIEQRRNVEQTHQRTSTASKSIQVRPKNSTPTETSDPQ